MIHKPHRLTNDLVWANRHLNWYELAAVIGYHPDSVGRAARTLGWVRRRGASAIQSGPCRECEASTPVEDLNHARICVSCRTNASDPAVMLYRQERERRLQGGR